MEESRDDRFPWKCGDVVVLKSGGPTMTVNAVHSLCNGTVECVWFDPGGIPQSRDFRSEALKKGAE